MPPRPPHRSHTQALARVQQGDGPPFCTSSLLEGIAWGVAGAAYQTEGALTAGGRSISVWDKYVADNPSKIRDNTTADVTCDFYNRYKEDIALMKSLGVKNYRFSISWGRVVPSGRKGGAVNQQGVEFYNNVINEMIRQGIAPAVTLYHWDLPQANQDAYKVGRWCSWAVACGARALQPPSRPLFQNCTRPPALPPSRPPPPKHQTPVQGFLGREVIEDYNYFAEVCFKTFGDRVKKWIT
jgi:beta-glucosidase/6-phospho-beta-glucosidase/beta-galactosidase